MSRHSMTRTTVRLPEPLMLRVKEEVSRSGKTLTTLIEEGLRMALSKSDRPPTERPKYTFQRNSEQGLPQSGINLNNNSQVADAMERIK